MHAVQPWVADFTIHTEADSAWQGPQVSNCSGRSYAQITHRVYSQSEELGRVLSGASVPGDACICSKNRKLAANKYLRPQAA